MTPEQAYYAFLDSRSNRIIPEGTYVEHHHRLPDAELGGNEPENMIWLTYPEHVYAHLLASRVWKSQVHAANIMINTVKSKGFTKKQIFSEFEKFFSESGDSVEFKNAIDFIVEAKKKHAEWASERMKTLNADPEFAKANSESGRESMKALHADPEHQKKATEGLRKKFKDPEFAKEHAERGRKRMKALNADPEFQAAHLERLKVRNADPEFRKAHAERMRAMNADPEFSKANSERMKAMRAEPEFRKRNADAIREAHTDHTIRIFENKNTGEKFIGKAIELRESYGLSSGDLSNVISGKRKSVKGWTYLGEYKE